MNHVVVFILYLLMDTLFWGTENCFCVHIVVWSQHLRSEETVCNVSLWLYLKHWLLWSVFLSYLQIMVTQLWKIITFLLVTVDRCCCHSDLWNKLSIQNICYTFVSEIWWILTVPFFCIMMMCHWIIRSPRFKEMYCLCSFMTYWPRIWLPHDALWCPKRTESSAMLLWKS